MLESNLSGVIIVDKPEGMSSFAMISLMRRITGIKKIGHSGTLDPFATGVLPICVGKATRLIRYLGDDSKEYLCTIRFGSFSDTQDTEGTLYGGRKPSVHERVQMQQDDYSKLRKIFMEMQGDILQTPPIYSAIKINGKKAYEYARKGQNVEIKPRWIRIHASTIIDIQAEPELEVVFSISCSKGTYIRSVCEEIGKRSGYGAYALQLRRIKSGRFAIENASTPKEIETAKSNGTLCSLFLPEEVCVSHLPPVALSFEEAERIRHGILLPLSSFYNRLYDIKDTQDTHQIRFRALFENKLIAIIYPSTATENRVMRIERMLDK